MCSVFFISHPYSVRPWQHILEPLSGYINLAEELFSKGEYFASSFNFGPEKESNKTVLELVKNINSICPISWELDQIENKFHEANYIGLDISKAKKILDWEPKWRFSETIENTLSWYLNYYQGGKNCYDLCINDIEKYLL